MWNENVSVGKSPAAGMTVPSLQKPLEYGLGSVIRDLDKEVGIACELAYNLNNILGTSNPPSDAGATQSASGHFGAVSDALNRLRYANQNLSRAIQHLNS